MRFSVAAACLSLCLVGFSSADNVHASIRKETNIPAEGLGPALNALAKDRNFQIVYVTEEVANVRTEGAVGEFTTEEALKQLLSGTGLTYRYLDDKTVTIGSATTPQARSGPASQTKSSGSSGDANANQEGNKSSSGIFRVAQMDQGKGASSTSVREQASAQENSRSPSAGLQEIIVTAQKRNERLQDVPIPVTAISGDTLVSNNTLRIQDYYSTIPGLSISPVGSTGSYQTLTIRGISTGQVANPTVGVTVDDVPFGTSTSNGGGGTGQIVPDVDPGDLARIEVLRGPQGTLYGASSMGGLLKFVTVDPSTDGFSGRVEADASDVHNGANLGMGLRGSANVPLGEAFAMRVSAFGRGDPGYVDNFETGERGVNRDTADGGHLSALWRPSELFSLKLSALYQDIRGDGSSDVDKQINGYVGPVLGDLQQYHIRGSGDYERSLQAYSAMVTAKLGRAELTSISGYNIQQFADSFDATSFASTLTPAGQSVPNFGVAGDTSPESDRTKKLTQELRLSVPIGEKVNWLIGGFYTYENSKYFQNIQAEDPASGEVVASVLTDHFFATYMETAVFTDMTLRLTDRFDIQVGGRESQIRQTFSDEYGGPLTVNFYGMSPYIQPQLDSKANAFTYLVTPKFQLSSAIMVYARFASGYRPGGSNYGAGASTGVPGQYIPGQYAPDKTENYELGLKGEFLDHTFSVDASLYYIDWKNMQVSQLDLQNGDGWFANASGAKSQGLELSIQSRPLTGLTIAGWIAISDAVLTQAFPTTSLAYGVSGDRLPYSSRFSSNLSVQQDFPLSGRLSGFAGGAVAYVGDREGEFTTVGTDPADRARFPGYAKVDLRAGAKYEGWTASLAINNVTDQRGILSGGLGAFPAWGFVYIQPRTVALSVVRTF